MKNIFQAERFWEQYKKELRDIFINDPLEAKEAYRSDFAWTPKAMCAAKIAMTTLDTNVVPQIEYFRIDLIGYVTHPENKNVWDLRVAFEHENRDSWPSEICKLCHVVADLRVVVSYWNFKDEKKPLDSVLRRNLEEMKDQIQRSRSEWLFIFGPRCRSFGSKNSFIAYKYDYDRKEPIKLEDQADALNPNDYFQYKKER